MKLLLKTELKHIDEVNKAKLHLYWTLQKVQNSQDCLSSQTTNSISFVFNTGRVKRNVGMLTYCSD